MDKFYPLVCINVPPHCKSPSLRYVRMCSSMLHVCTAPCFVYAVCIAQYFSRLGNSEYFVGRVGVGRNEQCVSAGTLGHDFQGVFSDR